MSNDDPTRTDTVRLDRPGGLPRGGPGSTQVLPPPHGWQPPPPGWGPPPQGPPPSAPGGAGGGGASWTPPPVPPRRNPLTRITLGAAVLTVGVLWLLTVADVLALGPGQIASAALLVLGLGLLVGSMIGRSRGLIVAGLVLLPVVLLLQLVQPSLAGMEAGGPSVGQRFESPAELDALRDSYQLGAGELRLDLSGIEFTEDRDVAVQVGFGTVQVLVPEDVSVEVVARLGAGEARLIDLRSDGVGIDREVVDEVDGSEHLLRVEVEVGLGQVFVDRLPVDGQAPPDGFDDESATGERRSEDASSDGAWSEEYRSDESWPEQLPTEELPTDEFPTDDLDDLDGTTFDAGTES